MSRGRAPWWLRGRALLRARLGGEPERGSVALLVLGVAVVALTLVVGGVAVTSAQLSRIHLLDAADGAALDAADALDAAAYHAGLGGAVALTDASVRQSASGYLAARPLPGRVRAWRLARGTGASDGRTAVVRLTGEADLPLVGGALRALGGSVTITVESRARAELVP